MSRLFHVGNFLHESLQQVRVIHQAAVLTAQQFEVAPRLPRHEVLGVRRERKPVATGFDLLSEHAALDLLVSSAGDNKPESSIAHDLVRRCGRLAGAPYVVDDDKQLAISKAAR